MKYVDEFRDAKTIRRLADEITDLVDPGRTYRIMEICGGHTHSIFRFGLSQLLPDNIDLIHGPGCPVCVLPMGRMDVGLAMAERDGLIFTAFGDMMRVPGSTGSPLESKARGADIRMVYSPLDALKIAQENPHRPVMFFAIGFETTAPSTAVTIMRGKAAGVGNFFVFCNHILVNPAIRALLDMDDMRLDAFIGPGHVSTVIGCEPYRFIAEDYGRPIVVSGFEPVDILQSIAMILKQMNDGTAKVENQYERALPWEGNPAARAAMDLVFETRDTFEWRGLGRIPHSAYAIREEFAEFDAEKQIGVHGQT
ncbi:MAG TPA: hydrogenase formation protein HypD, partial [Phycisphaerales bacterium]|nr:hydrogenase formation protein HypD [Phycisphaerales bacterium]